MKRHSLFLGVVFVLATLVQAAPFSASRASALSGSSFNAANIIGDGIFFNSNTMDISTIQAFLNSKVPTCDTNGSQPSGRAGYATRADFGRASGVPPPYTCVKDYVQSVPQIAPDAFCGGMSGGNKSAAMIIYDVAKVCGINPQSLIVLLQKEQSLITDDWPWPIQYRSATGYGCPDTAPCDAEYYGFFNQVYRAARQFKRYVLQPNSFNYAAGRTSYIAYNPNAGCGGSNISIQNGATAALYNYTPYQPNAAALNNLYGIGDGCSAYGNRNFWRMFNDWFGSTRSTSLVRTNENPLVYLIAYDKKYPIYSSGLLYDLTRPLGEVSYTSQAYLDSLQTGAALKRAIKSNTNADLYFFDAGYKLKFTSCEMLVAYGMACGQEAVLNDYQMAAMQTGPDMTAFFQTTNNTNYYISGGSRSEVYDEQSRQNAGLSGYYNRLEADAIENLPLGSPVIRSNVIVRGFYTANYYYYRDGEFTPIPSEFLSSPFIAGMTHGSLTDDTILRSTINPSFNGFIANTSGSNFLVDGSGKKQLTSPSDWSSTFNTDFDDSVISQTPTSSQPINNGFVKPSNSPVIYYVQGAKKYPMEDWNYFVKLNGNSSSFATLYPSSTNAISDGPPAYVTDSLVKPNNSPNVYYIDGFLRKWYVGSFGTTNDMGVSSNVRTVDSSSLATYQEIGNLTNLINCNGTKYAASNGTLFAVSLSVQNDYGWADNQFNSLNSVNCGYLPTSTQELTNFIRTNDGKIYKIASGQKRHVTSMQTYTTQGGTSQNTLQVSDNFAATIPTGASL